MVSLAAGVTIATFEQHPRRRHAVLVELDAQHARARRASAVTGLAAGTDADRRRPWLSSRRLFETVGAVIEVPEAQIDPLSTISGSGPAYFFLLVEELTKAAVGKGFTEADARLMAQQTFIGAAALLEQPARTPPRVPPPRDEPRGRPSVPSLCCRRRAWTTCSPRRPAASGVGAGPRMLSSVALARRARKAPAP